MRGPVLAELGLLARVLLPVPAGRRMLLAHQILAEVDAAALHLRTTGRGHPVFGDGSLMARCLALSPTSEPFVTDPHFLAALVCACKALQSHSRL